MDPRPVLEATLEPPAMEAIPHKGGQVTRLVAMPHQGEPVRAAGQRLSSVCSELGGA